MLKEKENTNLVFKFGCGHTSRQYVKHVQVEDYDRSKPNRYQYLFYQCMECRAKRNLKISKTQKLRGKTKKHQQ